MSPTSSRTTTQSTDSRAAPATSSSSRPSTRRAAGTVNLPGSRPTVRVGARLASVGAAGAAPWCLGPEGHGQALPASAVETQGFDGQTSHLAPCVSSFPASKDGLLVSWYPTQCPGLPAISSALPAPVGPSAARMLGDTEDPSFRSLYTTGLSGIPEQLCTCAFFPHRR